MLERYQEALLNAYDPELGFRQNIKKLPEGVQQPFFLQEQWNHEKSLGPRVGSGSLPLRP